MTIEFSDNLGCADPATLLAAVNNAALKSGLFEEADIKSRAYAASHFLIGVEDSLRAFIHVRISLLSGRLAEERRILSELVLSALDDALGTQSGTELQLSVETLEIDRQSYTKVVRRG